MKLRIQKLHPAAKVPTYSTDGAACFDLYAATVNGKEDEEAYCYQGNAVTVGTGLAFEVPDGYMLAIRPRSGLAFNHGVQAFQGTIDSDFRKEVMVILTCDNRFGVNYAVQPGDRIAQACLIEVPRVEFSVCEQLTISDRGGFGSTGK